MTTFVQTFYDEKILSLFLIRHAGRHCHETFDYQELFFALLTLEITQFTERTIYREYLRILGEKKKNTKFSRIVFAS